ncbi:MAG: type II toxin-antitoxin system RelE/ParE family toxin [endosymbiont of Escarpia spicata]|uniref:Toxin n=1 Tax=endosymbiont of Escarpia spicata TaxID=2200908 RepID=A0A370DH20_9GAMM|nr:MAG: type II toxin-antitoxin system RelE/ParE family toxin [endosymbiont of Escarpia spicata]
MHSYYLLIAPLARDDLKRIYDYGVSNWGATQASSYLEKLKEHFWGLTKQPKMGIEREKLMPSMRSFPVGSHIVFYRLQQSQVEVVRVLHCRQDPQRHIKYVIPGSVLTPP